MSDIVITGGWEPGSMTPDQGGQIIFWFIATWSDSPPASYNWKIQLIDTDLQVVEGFELTGTGIPGEKEEVPWNGKIIDESDIKKGSYRLKVTVDTEEQEICNGIAINAGVGEFDFPTTSTNNSPNGTADDPVSMLTGSHNLHVVDINIPSIGIPLVVERMAYSGAGHSSLQNQALNEWMFNFNEFIWKNEFDNSLTVIFFNRNQYRFEKNGDSYTAAASFNHHSLEELPDGSFLFTMQDGMKHYFNSDCYLVRVENRAGHSVNYEYYDFDPVTYRYDIKRITDSCGRHLDFTYPGAEGGYTVMTITDWTDRTWQYYIDEFDARSLYKFVDPEGNETIYKSESPGTNPFAGVQEIAMPNGTMLTIESMGPSPLITKVKKMTFGNDSYAEFDYDFDNFVTTVTRGDREYTYEFSDDGLLLKVTDSLGNETSYTYDSNRNKISETDWAGNVTSYTYDSDGNMLTITDPLERTTTFEYNGYGQITKETGPPPNNRVREWEYDSDTGNLLTFTDWDGSETTYEYYSNGLCKKITNPGGQIVEYEYDGAGNITKTTSTPGGVVENEYDNLGRKVKEVDENDRETKWEYNKNNQTTKRIDHNGEETSYEYDGNLNRVRTLYSDGTSSSAQYDVMNNLTSSTDIYGRESAYDYDEYLQTTKITGPNGLLAEFEYDLLGRRTKEIDSSGNVKEYAYGDNWQTETDSRGITTTWEYDEAGRLVKVTYGDGTFVTYTYDDNRMILTQPGDRYGEIRYGGNDFGSFKFGAKTYGGSGSKYGFNPEENLEYWYYGDSGKLWYVKYPRNKIIAYQYDANGRTSTITDVRGYETDYTYNASGQVTKVAYRGEETDYTYDSEGRISTITLPNGIVKTVAYHVNELPESIKYEKGSTVLYRFDYEYDDNDVLLSKKIQRNSYFDNTLRYLYDSDGRVTGIFNDGKLKYSYEYDDKGNIILRKDENDKTTEYNYNSAGKAVRAGGVRYDYDADGNMTSLIKADRDAPMQFVYDNSNNLAMTALAEGYSPPVDGIPDVDPLGLYVWRYRYYPDSRMSKKISPSGRELRFYYDGGKILNEEGWFQRTAEAEDGYTLPTGDEEDHLTHVVSWFNGPESSPIGIDTTPTNAGPGEKCINYYLTDETNSVIALSDEFGNVTVSYEYDDFQKRTIKLVNTTPEKAYNPLGWNCNYVEEEIVCNNQPSQPNPQPNPTPTTEIDRFENLVFSIRSKLEQELATELPGYEYMCFQHASSFSWNQIQWIALQEGYYIDKLEVIKWEEGKLNGHWGVYMEVYGPSGDIIYFYTDVNRMEINPLLRENYSGSYEKHNIEGLYKGGIKVSHNDALKAIGGFNSDYWKFYRKTIKKLYPGMPKDTAGS